MSFLDSLKMSLSVKQGTCSWIPLLLDKGAVSFKKTRPAKIKCSVAYGFGGQGRGVEGWVQLVGCGLYASG